MFAYFFCKLFKVLRVKNYIAFSDGTFKRIYIKTIPDIIFYKKENKHYHVVKVVTEIINDTMIYNWISVE